MLDTSRWHNPDVLRLVVAIAVASLILPPSASAALSFAFDRAQARPGQVVRAFQADSEGVPLPAWSDMDPATVTMYLVRVRNPSAWRLKLGPMRIDADRIWNITFRVPKKLRPGLYTTAFFCRPCGNTFFPSTLPGDRWTRKPSRVLKVMRSVRR